MKSSRRPRFVGAAVTLVLAGLLGACTHDAGDEAEAPTTTMISTGEEGIVGVDLQPVLEGWSIHALDAEEYRPRPENNCREANGVYDEAARQRVFSAILDSGGATVAVDLVEYQSESAATSAYEMLVKLDVVCVVPNLAGLSDVRRAVAPDSWRRIGDRHSYGWQASVSRQGAAVYPTLHSAVAFAEGDVVAIVTTVRTDGIIDDPVPLATELRTQLAS
jgi:hypothetical protein